MRSRLACAVVALALTACTRAGPPPPDFQGTLEAIRIELTGMAATPVPIPATATSSATPTEVAPTATPSATETAPPTPTAAPTATPSPEPSPTPVTYIVQPGDYPGRIASLFGVSVEALMEANEITDPRRLSVGQVLVIPFPEAE